MPAFSHLAPEAAAAMSSERRLESHMLTWPPLCSIVLSAATLSASHAANIACVSLAMHVCTPTTTSRLVQREPLHSPPFDLRRTRISTAGWAAADARLHGNASSPPGPAPCAPCRRMHPHERCRACQHERAQGRRAARADARSARPSAAGDQTAARQTPGLSITINCAQPMHS